MMMMMMMMIPYQCFISLMDGGLLLISAESIDWKQ